MTKAFLGTGLLGSGFVRAMLKRGDSVRVWNRTFTKAKALEADGAKAFGDATQAVAGASLIHIALNDDASVDQVLNPLAGSLAPGAILIDHTTTSVKGTIDRTAHWKSAGFTYLHAPVFMNPEEALKIGGTMLISGDPAAVQKVTPELSKMTGKLVNLGSETGKSTGMKLLGNLFWISFTALVSDMITFSNSAELSKADILKLFDIWNLSKLTPARVESLLTRNRIGYDHPSWGLNMARKDARLMMESSAQKDDSLILVSAVAEAMDQSIEKGLEYKDWEITFKQTLEKTPADR